MARLARLTLFSVLVVMLGVPGSRAEEAILEEAPAPESVEEEETALEKGFEEEPEEIPLFWRLKQKLRDLPPFVRDTKLDLHLRNYYFRSENFDDTESEAWTLGGSLAYQSGWLRETVQVGAELFTSHKLHAPDDRDGTLLLRTGQKSYTVVGQSYAKIKYDDHVATLYRSRYRLPYVNTQDNRMSPNTFEGYTLMGKFGSAGGTTGLEYVTGYLTRMKQRNSRSFITLPEAAGIPGNRKRGMTIAGFRFSAGEDLSIGAINFLTWDVLNILYAESSFTWSPVDGLGLRLTGQFTDQRSVGDDLLTGSAFDTRTFGGRVAASYAAATLRAAFSTTANEGEIRSPFGTKPGFLNLMIHDFDRQGEDSWLVGFSYDFKRLGLEGLSVSTSYARGHNVCDDLHNREEVDLTLDYKLKRGRLRGLWLRFRGAFSHERGTGDSEQEVRVILRYDLPAL